MKIIARFVRIANFEFCPNDGDIFFVKQKCVSGFEEVVLGKGGVSFHLKVVKLQVVLCRRVKRAGYWIKFFVR
jgi:hypothetical protein